MLEAHAENKQGQSIRLTQNETQWQITSIDGLGLPNTVINTMKLAGDVGERFVSRSVEPRTITIRARLCGDVEANRVEFFKFFHAGAEIVLFFKTGSRNVKISGFVEKGNINFFELGETIVVSIECLYPYFSATEPIEVATTATYFYVDNPGNVACGAFFRARYRGYWMDASVDINLKTVLSVITGPSFVEFVCDSSIETGKDVYVVDSRGVRENKKNKISPVSTWPMLEPGENYVKLWPAGDSLVRFYPQYATL